MKRGATSRLLKGCLAILILCACVETAFRIAFSFRVGPSVLWFGTPLGTNKIRALAPTLGELEQKLDVHTVRTHASVGNGYTKYFPNQKRVDYDPETGDDFEVGINRHGLRGDDFSIAKEPGVTRVVTLGASSTFGYFNRDSTTYPVLLEEELNQRCESRTYEVINLGIPHLRSQEILALFLHEGRPLDPDVVTFYEGINDSAARPRSRLWSQARRRLVVGAFIDNVARVSKRYSAEDLEEHIAGKGERFLENLSRMLEACNEDGALFLVGLQQSKSELIARDRIRGVTKSEEVELVRQALAQRELTNSELVFLTHHLLMEDTRDWATANGVPIFDVVAATDDRRDVLLSWVHLNLMGNGIVAETLAAEILKSTCPPAEPAEPAAAES